MAQLRNAALHSSLIPTQHHLIHLVIPDWQTLFYFSLQLWNSNMWCIITVGLYNLLLATHGAGNDYSAFLHSTTGSWYWAMVRILYIRCLILGSIMPRIYSFFNFIDTSWQKLPNLERLKETETETETETLKTKKDRLWSTFKIERNNYDVFIWSVRVLPVCTLYSRWIQPTVSTRDQAAYKDQ